MWGEWAGMPKRAQRLDFTGFCALFLCPGALGSGRASAVPTHTQNWMRKGLIDGTGSVDRGEMCGGAFQNQKYTFLSQSGQKSVFFFVGSVGFVCWNEGEKRQKLGVQDPLLVWIDGVELIHLR